MLASMGAAPVQAEAPEQQVETGLVNGPAQKGTDSAQEPVSLTTQPDTATQPDMPSADPSQGTIAQDTVAQGTVVSPAASMRRQLDPQMAEKNPPGASPSRAPEDADATNSVRNSKRETDTGGKAQSSPGEGASNPLPTVAALEVPAPIPNTVLPQQRPARVLPDVTPDAKSFPIGLSAMTAHSGSAAAISAGTDHGTSISAANTAPAEAREPSHAPSAAQTDPASGETGSPAGAPRGQGAEVQPDGVPGQAAPVAAHGALANDGSSSLEDATAAASNTPATEVADRTQSDLSAGRRGAAPETSSRSVHGTDAAVPMIQSSANNASTQPASSPGEIPSVVHGMAGASHASPHAYGAANASPAMSASLPGSSSRETFAALDGDAEQSATSWTHAGAHSAEAGFEDPALGWVGVRADLSASGVHAAVVPGSTEAAQALSGHMAGLHAYLSEQRTPVDTLTLASPTNGGAYSNQGMSQQMQQGNGQGTEQRGFMPPSPGPSGTASSETRSPASSVQAIVPLQGQGGVYISVVA